MQGAEIVVHRQQVSKEFYDRRVNAKVKKNGTEQQRACRNARNQGEEKLFLPGRGQQKKVQGNAGKKKAEHGEAFFPEAF